MSVSGRAVIVVDTETTGLDVKRAHQATEVGWLYLGQYGGGCFIPPHSIEGADPEALRISRYHERIAGQPVDLDYSATHALHIALRGNVLAGSAPGFDAGFLSRLFRDAGFADDEPWYRHTVDLGVYAAGVLGYDPADALTLREVCEALGVERDEADRHTAFGDAKITAYCLGLLRDIATSRNGKRAEA